MKTPSEINNIAYKALLEVLSFDEMIRFLRQFDMGQGDYTMERHQNLDHFTPLDIFQDIENHSSQ